MNLALFGLQELSVVLAPELAKLAAGNLRPGGPWRPPEWNQPALTMITVPGTLNPATAGSTENVGGVDINLPGAPAFQNPPQYLVFDAVLCAQHVRELRPTEHPIQTSVSSPVASIVDHAYQLPARVTLDIGMSDAMQSYLPGMWTGNASKSVSAYETLVSLQRTRTLVTLTTRLETYRNMLIQQVAPADTVQTRRGLRASVTLVEIFLVDATAVSSRLITNASADDTTQPNSARAQTTASSLLGTIQTGNPGASLQAQNQINSQLASGLALGAAQSIPGAGAWSSINVSQLRGLFS